MAACVVCARSKALHRPTAGLLRPLPVPSRPWSHIALDFVTPLMGTAILTIVDRFSKMVYYMPLAKLPSTTGISTARIPAPWTSFPIVAPQFTYQVWQVLCKAFDITCSLTLGYHPQSNRQTDDLETALHCFTAQNPSSWSSFLTWVEYSHNSLSSVVTGMTPFMAAYSYQPPLLSSQERDIMVPSVQAHIACCTEVWRMAREAITRTTQRSQHVADRHCIPAPTFLPGQKVWLSSRDLPLQVESRKLAPRFVGPYEVERVINPSAVHLKLSASLPVHPTFHVSQLKPVSPSDLSPPAKPPPPTQLIDSDPTCTVIKILDVHCSFQFLVDWVGYSPEESLWVSRALMLEPTLLHDFYREFPHKLGRAM